MTTLSQSFATRPIVLRLSTAAEIAMHRPLLFGKSMSNLSGRHIARHIQARDNLGTTLQP